MSKQFKVVREVRQIFTIKAKSREDAVHRLLDIGTPSGFFETHIKTEKVTEIKK